MKKVVSESIKAGATAGIKPAANAPSPPILLNSPSSPTPPQPPQPPNYLDHPLVHQNISSIDVITFRGCNTTRPPKFWVTRQSKGCAVIETRQNSTSNALRKITVAATKVCYIYK